MNEPTIIIPIACILITLTIVVYVTRYMKRVKCIISRHDIGNGLIGLEYYDRIETYINHNNDFVIVTFYDKTAFNQYKDNIIKISSVIGGIFDSLDLEIRSSCKAINVNLISWKIESMTIHDINENTTIFVDIPLNPEIKWGLEIDINLKSHIIENIGFSH